MEALKAQFPELTFHPLQAPTAHPFYEYDPFNPSTRILHVGHQKQAGRREFKVDTFFEKDVTVKMRDQAKLYTDVFRPVTSDGSEKVPAIIAWSPYGKSGGGQTYENMGPFRCGVPLEKTSGYEKFEAPDPADWCARGYAIINIDARGAGDSDGDIAFWGEQEAQDIYDTIEWASKQPWCSGSVVMAGNSWLAIAQVNFASRYSHPALKALAPWEAATDPYRDLLGRGGIPHTHFFRMIYHGLAGKGGVEDAASMLDAHPFIDEYWATKFIHTENIDVPLYLTASYTTGLHSRGSFDTFQRAKSSKKWLRVHPYQEWSDIYRPEVNDELQSFFDCYCKDAENGWESTPPLRVSLLGFNGSPVETILERPAGDYPIPGTEYQSYFLNAADGSMARSKPKDESTTSYEAHHVTDCSEFTVHFDRYTELAGYPTAKLWVSADQHHDLDVCVQIRKVAKDGKPLVSLNYMCPVPEPEVPDVNIAKFLGPDGMLRASHRVTKQTVDGRVQYAHDRAEKVAPGQVVELEIPIWPIGMVFEAGEGIMLRVAGHELRLPEVEVLRSDEPSDENVGRHQIHTGGRYDSPPVTSPRHDYRNLEAVSPREIDRTPWISCRIIADGTIASFIIPTRRTTGRPSPHNVNQHAFAPRLRVQKAQLHVPGLSQIIHQIGALADTGDKPFVCSSCGRAFARSDSLTRHMRIHAKAESGQQVRAAASTNDTASLSGASDIQLSFNRTNERRVSAVHEPDPAAHPEEYAFTTGAFAEFDSGLAWPDAEQLLQTIISSDWNSLTLPPEAWSASQSNIGAVSDAQIDPRLQDSQAPPNESNESHMAIQSLSSMITNVSSRVTSAVETLPDLTSAFLDNCLQTYFTRFNPTFPVLHRPTFVFRECSPSLLLNAIALGSLFIGTEDAVSKGETLWRLAYTAVSTSTYAMMSKNEGLRVTSQIYQSLSFNWARHCDLFDFETLAPFILPDPNDREGLVRSWKTWVSRELQLRALLGHYILDGQLSFLSGQPTSVLHTTNPLLLSSNQRLFDSQTVDDWYTEMKAFPQNHTSFRDIYGTVFESQALDPALGGSPHAWNFNTQIDVRVVLECIHALVRETQDPLYVQPTWRPPTPSDVGCALLQVRHHLEAGWSHNSVERLGLLMRWHLVGLASVSKSMAIITDLCRQYQIQQSLFRIDDAQEARPSWSEWVDSSADAKRALLHAAAIQDIATQLPLSHINSMWTPIPIFAAATIYALFCLNGISTVALPPTVDWSVVLDVTDSGAGSNSYEDKGRSKTQIFLASSIRTPSPTIGQAKNLRYDLSYLQTIIHALSVQWGCYVYERLVMTQAPETMSGVLIEEGGDISKLQWRTDLHVPTPDEGEVLIRNEFAGVNYMDTHFRSGRYPASYPLVLGGEAAGTVVSAHPSIANYFKHGDRVAYLAKSGAYAQYSTVSTTRVVQIPDDISSAVAAVSLAQGLTALTLVRESHAVRAGEWILVHGASGGVGSQLIQMCRAANARVIGTASTAQKAEVVRGLGAEFVIDTSAEDWVARTKQITKGHGADAIFDPVGRATFDGDLEVIARKGSLVCFGNVSGMIPPVDVLRLGGTKNIKLCYPTVFAYLATREETQEYADGLFDMILKAEVKVDGYNVYELRDVGKAHDELEGRRSVGKLVVRIP
ncbi:putative Alpha/Beta hydrolase protein [Seiridium unicorne]|uniref:Alpha/Beta hydrolase protein n=1 Tax=Seiridium unicorne TaxID=138068 RepID=A0ABR2UY46_9PEZI